MSDAIRKAKEIIDAKVAEKKTAKDMLRAVVEELTKEKISFLLGGYKNDIYSEEAIEEEGLLQNAKKMGEYLVSKLNGLKKSFPAIIKEIKDKKFMALSYI